MILISSRTWRAHHRPERCFEVYGLQLHSSTTHLVTPHFPARWVMLQDPPLSTTLTATYWFQSAGQTSDDYATRLWADVTLRPETWILVSLLFEEPQDPHNPQVQTLYEQLHQLVGTQLKVESEK
jgi:exosortase O